MTLKSLLVALSLLPTYREDTAAPEKSAQLAAMSTAIHAAAKTPDEAAFLIACGRYETAFSLRIHAGQCRPLECDRGRARGPWQVHRNSAMSDAQWDRMHGVENIDEQALVAASRARWALRQCPADRVRGAFRVLGGLGCSRALRGEEQRVAAFRAARARL
jgi:hypothetical protein